MFSMKNFVMPSDPHSMHAKEKDVPTVVFKPKKEKMEKKEIKPERRAEQAPKSVVEKKEIEISKPRVAEAQERAIVAEKAVEQVAKPVEAPKRSSGPKKIRFEKGSAEAVEWGKEMSLRRKLKKEGTMKEKVVEVKPMTETIIAESVKPVA
jgi:hypothetical protein